MKQKKHLYPFKFHPIFKEKVWGGSRLQKILHKQAGTRTGESWELSGIENDRSVVANGNLAGKTIDEILKTYKEDLVGTEVYKSFGNTFPLLFKFIDAQQDLSVQVHPDDNLARERHNSFGKSEMWYVVDAEKDAGLIVGFKDGINKEKYLRALASKTVPSLLNFEKVNPGDSFLINAGTVHAIGKGVLLAEIQQASDITYRIYDWDRPDINGKMRELHTGLAMDAINFTIKPEKISYQSTADSVVSLGGNSYFSVNKLRLTKDFHRNIGSISSFVVYMCLEGKGTIQTESFSESFSKGETLLIPATFSSLNFNTQAAVFLEVFIP